MLHERSEYHPSDRETSINTIQACLGLWLALLGFIASPNNHNEGFTPPLASHPPYNVPPVLLQWLWKKLLKTQQCKLDSRNSYITLAKRLFQFYSIHIYLAWLYSSTRELWIFTIRISLWSVNKRTHIKPFLIILIINIWLWYHMHNELFMCHYKVLTDYRNNKCLINKINPCDIVSGTWHLLLLLIAFQYNRIVKWTDNIWTGDF